MFANRREAEVILKRYDGICGDGVPVTATGILDRFESKNGYIHVPERSPFARILLLNEHRFGKTEVVKGARIIEYNKALLAAQDVENLVKSVQQFLEKNQ